MNAEPLVSLGTRKILLVEDEAIIALRERKVLERNGYTVIVVHSGEDAVDRARNDHDISLILMDIDLGSGIDGSEAAEQILAERDVPIAFLSSHTEPEVVEKTDGITSYGYIVKNSGDTVLLASIKMAFRLHEAKTIARNTSRMMAAILDVSRRLVATLDLQTILQTASDHLSRLTGMDAGALYLLDGDTIVMAAATPEIPPDFPAEYRSAPRSDHPHIAVALERQQPLVVPDTRGEDWTPAEQGVVDARNLTSLLYVPLVSQKRSVGVYITGSTGFAAPADDLVIDLCMTLANIAAVAIENALLFKRYNEE